MDAYDREMVRRIDSGEENIDTWPEVPRPPEVRVSVNDVLAGRLPDDARGVHWTDTGWTECREHLTHDSWLPDDRSDVPTGIVLIGPVQCDACREHQSERADWS